MESLNIFETVERELQRRINKEANTLANQAIWDAQARTGVQLTEKQMGEVLAKKKGELQVKAVEAIFNIVFPEAGK